MVLVSGRPISFKMNLYEPLYIPRPSVEPELFASLRPPVYDSALNYNNDRKAEAGVPGGGAIIGGSGGLGAGAPPAPAAQGKPGMPLNMPMPGFGVGGFGGQGGGFNNYNPP